MGYGCRHVFFWTAFLMFTLSGEAAFARNETVPGSPYTSGRAAAMGDSSLAIDEDGPSAIFDNPAALGKIRGVQLEPVNISLAPNSQLASSAGLNFFTFPSLSAYQNTLNGKPGPFPSLESAYCPTFAFRDFGVGMLMQASNAAQSNGAQIRYVSKYQLIPAVGGSLRFASGVIRIGYTAQWVNEAVGDITVPKNQNPIGYNQDLKQGSALSNNFGFALTLPFTYLPSLNIVARNVLGATYGTATMMPIAKNSTGAPPTDPMSIDTSVSMVDKLGNGAMINAIAEYHDGLNASNTSFMLRTSLGLELDVRESFFIRMGYGNGYPTAGIGLRRNTGELNLTWYSEELGKDYNDERNIKYMMQYTVRAF